LRQVLLSKVDISRPSDEALEFLATRAFNEEDVKGLLALARGERLVRFAYSTDGTRRRGPVTFRPRDIEKLHAALAQHPALAAALDLGGG